MSGIRGIELSKSYHHYLVLKELSFQVFPGECLALLGPNGAGKTTLMKILATLQRPTSGRFEIMGLDGVKERAKIREMILFLAHGSFLYNDLDALENIRFALAMYGVSSDEKEVKRTLDRVEIGAFSKFKVRAFSEGMKKRLALAKAMLIRPKVLLMDEPYSSLDERGLNIVNNFIRDMMDQGTAVIMTSHNRAKSAEVALRAAVLDHGGLREIPSAELKTTHELF